MGITVVVSVLFLLFGEFGLTLLFGEKIVPYVYLLQPIASLHSDHSYIWFFMDILIVYRRMKEVLIGNAVAFAAVFPLSYWLIRCCGANGVSFAGALATFWAACCWCTMRFERYRKEEASYGNLSG